MFMHLKTTQWSGNVRNCYEGRPGLVTRYRYSNHIVPTYHVHVDAFPSLNRAGLLENL